MAQILRPAICWLEYALSAGLLSLRRQMKQLPFLEKHSMRGQQNATKDQLRNQWITCKMRKRAQHSCDVACWSKVIRACIAVGRGCWDSTFIQLGCRCGFLVSFWINEQRGTHSGSSRCQHTTDIPYLRQLENERLCECLAGFGDLCSTLACGYGSKLNHQGTAGFCPCFHLPGFHLRYLFLTHSHVFEHIGLVLKQ